MKQPKLLFTDAASVKALREDLQLNQRDFWPRVGITQSGGSRYELGRRIPKAVQMLLQVAYAKDKPSADLVAWLREGQSEGKANS